LHELLTKKHLIGLKTDQLAMLLVSPSWEAPSGPAHYALDLCQDLLSY
jgi:hypothetical protein